MIKNSKNLFNINIINLISNITTYNYILVLNNYRFIIYSYLQTIFTKFCKSSIVKILNFYEKIKDLLSNVYVGKTIYFYIFMYLSGTNNVYISVINNKLLFLCYNP